MNLKFIRERRKELHLTLADLAKVLNMRVPSQYYKYESGEYKFKAEMLPKLAKALKCKITDFF